MTTVSATQARVTLYDLIDKVFKTGKPVGITKFGVLKAVLISVAQYELLSKSIYDKRKTNKK